MKNIAKIFLMFIITAFYACNDPNEGSTFQVYELNPVSTYLETRPDEFSEWIKVLKYADLFNAINQASESFTVFVPDNAAVKEFYKKKGVTSIEELGKEYAINLAKFHIIKDTISLEKFVIGGKLETPTLSDDFLSVSFSDDSTAVGGYNSMYVNKEARIKESPVRVSNGYVYVLNATLTPLIETLYARIAETPNYSIFKQVLEATSWSDSLNTIYDEARQANGSTLISKRNYTVLAVSDQAFNKDGIYSVADLVAKIEVTNNDYKNSENELFLYAAYHISKGNYTLEDLLKFDGNAKKKLVGTLAEAVIEISLDTLSHVYLNYGSDDTRAQFIENLSDKSAKNGIYHEIDGYLPIWQSETPVTVYFDLCDYPEVAAYIKMYGTAGQTYQMDAVGEIRTNISTLPTYNLVMPATPKSTASYNYLDYFTVKNAGSAWTACRFKDQLIINAGLGASISMKTPTIIKGKYKVTLAFCYATSMDFIRLANTGSNGGLMEFSFDDENKIESKPYSTVGSNTLGNYQYVLYNEMEFAKTGTHIFKIVVKDPAAGTNDKFRIQLDYVLFEPVPPKPITE